MAALKRRELVRSIGLGSASAAIAACTPRTRESGPPVSADLPRIEWRAIASWPKALDTIFGGLTSICDRVKDLSGGQFTIIPHAAGEIVGALEVMDAVQLGTVECGHSSSYYYIGKSRGLAFATSVPFGLTAQQQNAWLYAGGGLTAIQAIYRDFNIINFPAGNTGTQMGGWFKREVNSLGDLQALKMRIPGLGGEVMSRLGVSVQVLPGSEVFLALDRGTIDAAEWVGPYDDAKLGLNRAAPFYYYPGWWEPGSTLDFFVNLAAWNKLPKLYQSMIQVAAMEANLSMLAKYETLNAVGLQKLVAGGTKLRKYADPILKAARSATDELFSELSARDSSFKAIYDPWLKFRNEAITWNQTNEWTFADAMAIASS
jgi:TRAP-type mannitol/chloroaromatic compound transport system substrate-binding protein